MCKNYQNAINAFHRLTLNIPLYAAFRRKISSFIDNKINHPSAINNSLYGSIYSVYFVITFLYHEKCMNLDEVEVSV